MTGMVEPEHRIVDDSLARDELSTWIVMTVLSERPTTVWAWCRTGGGPGFEQIVFTRPDGVTPYEVSAERELVLGEMLFAYSC